MKNSINLLKYFNYYLNSKLLKQKLQRNLQVKENKIIPTSELVSITSIIIIGYY